MTEDAVTKDTLPEDAATEDTATEEAAAPEAETQDAAAPEAAPEGAVAQDAAAPEAGNEEAAPEGAVAQDAAAEGAVTEEAATEEAAPEGAATEEAAPQEAAPQEAAPQEAVTEEAPPQDTATEDAPAEDAVPEPILAPSSSPDHKWYILQTYSGFEHRVEKTVLEKLKVEKKEELVEEIFVPGEDVERVKNGKKRKTHVIYYPGYVLIKMKLTDDLWHLLMSIPRVSGFVGGNNTNPRPLDEEELGNIRSQMSQGVRQAVMKDEFEIGQSVIVIDGPFANFSGRIDEVSHDKSKLRVLISILGRSTPVELEFDKVKAHPDAT